MMFWKRAVVVFAMLAISCPMPARSQGLTTIRVSGSPNDDFKSIYYGVKAGIFKRYGLDVQPTIASSGSAAIAAVVGGSLEVALTGLPAVFQAHLHGLPLVVVAPAHEYSSDAASEMLVVKRDSPIHNGKDFDGQTLGSISLKDISSLATMAWIDKNGGDIKSLKMIELPGGAVPAALEENKIAGATLSAPFGDQALASGKARLLAKSYDAISKKFLSAGYIANTAFVTANKDAMSRFARAVQEATIYTNTHLPETVDIVAAYSGIDPAVLAKSHRMLDATAVDAADIQPLIDASAKYGIIERGFDANEIIATTAIRHKR